MPCLAAKPIVDGIERDLRGRAQVVRLNALSSIGNELAARYEVRGLPTTLVLDGGGEIVHRVTGLPKRKTVVAHATGA